MITFPSESYMRALAETLYAVSYLEWAIPGDLPRLSQPTPWLSVEDLSRMTMGGVATKVRSAASASADPEGSAWLVAAADALEEVVEPRNQIVHSHPATVDGAQVLYRWAAATPTKPHEAQAVTLADLNRLRDLAYAHLRNLNAVRLPA